MRQRPFCGGGKEKQKIFQKVIDKPPVYEYYFGVLPDAGPQPTESVYHTGPRRFNPGTAKVQQFWKDELDGTRKG
jgi:hypothetical protein